MGVKVFGVQSLNFSKSSDVQQLSYFQYFELKGKVYQILLKRNIVASDEIFKSPLPIFLESSGNLIIIYSYPSKSSRISRDT